MNIATYLTKNQKTVATASPRIFDIMVESDKKAVCSLFKERKIFQVIDDFEEQKREYFQIIKPQLIFDANFEKKFQNYLKARKKEAPLLKQGRWVYYPWSGVLTHILEHKAFFMVRTARNHNLITPKEQEKFYNTQIGIAGLSVGASIAFAIVLQGGARRIKLADQDRLALSNTNRIHAGTDALGCLKTEIVAQRIYEMNPYSKVELFSGGLTDQNIRSFFEKPKLDIIIDEVDNLAIKYRIREYAQKNKIPVVMAADNGDNGVIDIERYDKDKNIRFFQGRLGNVTHKELSNLNKLETGRMITKLVGPENVPSRMQDSLLEIGKTLVSWPQLGGTALLNGAAIAYCVRKIVNGETLENNRAIVSLDEALDPTHSSSKKITARRRGTEKFKKMFNLE